MVHYESFEGCEDWVSNTLTWFFVITLLVCTPFVYITGQVLWASGWPARKADTDQDQENDEEAVITDTDPLAQRDEGRNALLNTHSTMTGTSTPSQVV